MSTKKNSKERKDNYVNQLHQYIEEYKKVLVVNADNVGCAQLATVRKILRGKAVMLFGKKTMMRKGIELYNKKTPSQIIKLSPHCRKNVGLLFTNGDLAEIRKLVTENKVSAAAKAGQISQCRVIIPAQNTGMEPTKTSFFQALDIPTKITKGTVEIMNDFVLLEAGDKVGNSEATLLSMMNIKPFSYGLSVTMVYDNGAVFSPQVLDLTDEDIMKKFNAGIVNLTAVSLAANYPTEASIPHIIANNFKNLLAVAVGTEYSFKEAEEIKSFLKDPTKFAVAETPKVETSKKPEDTKKPEETKKPVEEEPKEESGGDMGINLFGDE